MQKVGFLGAAKSEKPECTNVLEDFEDERNEKSTLLKRSLILACGLLDLSEVLVQTMWFLEA